MKFRFMILFVLIFFSGCEILEEFNYVVVSAIGRVHVAGYNSNTETWGDYMDGVLVEMSLIKAGGERVDGTGTTGAGIGETTLHGTFNLYKEQPIDFKAKLVNNPAVIGSDKVTWDYVNKNRRYGGKNQPDICDVELFVILKVPIE